MATMIATAARACFLYVLMKIPPFIILFRKFLRFHSDNTHHNIILNPLFQQIYCFVYDRIKEIYDTI